MDYISSDTNVWIDFSVIDRIELPFRLPYTYIMNRDAIDDELLSPTGLRDELLKCGLVPVNITIEEFFMAQEFGKCYRRLSRYDRIALAISKSRRIILLTGDKALRLAAKSERVSVLGTIGILDQLLDGAFISKREYQYCLRELENHNGGRLRLPENEISSRLQRLK